VITEDINKRTYSPRELKKCIRPDDFWKYRIGKEKLSDETEKISKEFVESNFKLKELKRNKIGTKVIFTISSIYDALTIRRSNYIIKNNIKLTTFSREEEISQLHILLKQEPKTSWVFRSDIKSFFESIPFDLVINEMLVEKYISLSTFKHLLSIETFMKKYGDKGIPRGLPISSSISEFVLRNFDKSIRQMNACIYYARYVDDFIIILNKDLGIDKKKITDLLPFRLKLNDEKTYYEKIGSLKEIDFLGYTFPLNNPEAIKISKKKINKIKKRIVLSFKKFVKEIKFYLLCDRLKFLSGTTIMKIAGRKKNVFIGIKQNYKLCSEETILKQLLELDTFYKRILFSNNYVLSIKLREKLSQQQIKELKKISFIGGYNNNIKHFRTRKRISDIKNGWRYE